MDKNASASSLEENRHATVEAQEEMERLVPPVYFGIVEQGVYRSNAFEASNYGFIRQLGLRTVVYLSPELPPGNLKEFLAEEGIAFHHQGLKVWRPEMNWRPISEELAKETLEFILNTQNHPIMVMGSSGVQETGVVVGCLRRLQFWNLSSIFEEYRRFAGSKKRIVIEHFIELFDLDLVTIPVESKLPSWYRFELELRNRELQEYEHQQNEDSQQEVAVKNSYSKFYFDVNNSPLVSDNVQYDKKKSLCDDED